MTLKNLNVEVPDEDTDNNGDTWIESEKEDIEPETEEINEPFDPTQIRLETRQMTIDLVLSRIKHDELDLAPDFQRQAGIWNNTAKSRLIESILIRIPLPAFYIDATIEDEWLVIDGLQRLSTLKQFVVDQQLRLSELEFLVHLNGKTYNELTRNYQRRILETQLTLYLTEKGTPPEVKFKIFRRINTGGEPLSPQELRHATNPGKATKFLARLAQAKEFKQATNISNKRTIRMEDREFVLGFLAFTITSYKDIKAKNRDYFLDNAMGQINQMTEPQLKIIEDNFKRAMIAAIEIFGEDAFRKISNKSSNKRFPINKALFEAWSVNLSKLSDQQLQTLKRRREYLIDNFVKYINHDGDFVKSISQAANKIKYRFSIVEKLIQDALS